MPDGLRAKYGVMTATSAPEDKKASHDFRPCSYLVCGANVEVGLFGGHEKSDRWLSTSPCSVPRGLSRRQSRAALPSTTRRPSCALAKSVALSFTTPTLSSWADRRTYGVCRGRAHGKVHRVMPKSMVATSHSNRALVMVLARPRAPEPKGAGPIQALTLGCLRWDVRPYEAAVPMAHHG